MTAGEKHREEQEEIRTARMNRIFESAFELFSEKGIECISMNEIASKAEIGVASLYRYFTTKEDLAIEVAVSAWKKSEAFYREMLGGDSRSLTGYEELKKILEIFPAAVESHESFFRFIYYFDSFVKRERVSPERLRNYEKQISSSKDIIISVIEKGLADQSVSFDSIEGATVDELYFTITHSLFSLAQKLSLSGNMLYMDTEVSSKRQMELLIKIILKTLRQTEE